MFFLVIFLALLTIEEHVFFFDFFLVIFLALLTVEEHVFFDFFL